MSALQTLAEARYVNLETFRKNGTGVKTPVWVARVGDELVVFTDGTSYKVKRLRRNPAARLAECSVRGKIKGPWHEGTGRIVDEAELERAAYKALYKKYTWQMALTDWGGRLAGRAGRRAVLALRVND